MKKFARYIVDYINNAPILLALLIFVFMGTVALCLGLIGLILIVLACQYIVVHVDITVFFVGVKVVASICFILIITIGMGIGIFTKLEEYSEK